MSVFISDQSVGGSPIVLDVGSLRKLTHSNDVTEHPVETGSNVVDHFRPKSDEFSVDGVFSDFHHVGDSAFIRYGPGAAGDALANFAQLEALRLAGALIEIDTANDNLTNMEITLLEKEETSLTSGTVKFTLRARQIRVVQTQTVQVQKSTVATTRVDLGNQPGAQPPQAQVNQSFMRQIDDAAGSTDANGNVVPLGERVLTFMTSK